MTEKRKGEKRRKTRREIGQKRGTLSFKKLLEKRGNKKERPEMKEK